MGRQPFHICICHFHKPFITQGPDIDLGHIKDVLRTNSLFGKFGPLDSLFTDVIGNQLPAVEGKGLGQLTP